MFQHKLNTKKDKYLLNCFVESGPSEISRGVWEQGWEDCGGLKAGTSLLLRGSFNCLSIITSFFGFVWNSCLPWMESLPLQETLALANHVLLIRTSAAVLPSFPQKDHFNPYPGSIQNLNVWTFCILVSVWKNLIFQMFLNLAQLALPFLVERLFKLILITNKPQSHTLKCHPFQVRKGIICLLQLNRETS